MPIDMSYIAVIYFLKPELVIIVLSFIVRLLHRNLSDNYEWAIRYRVCLCFAL